MSEPAVRGRVLRAPTRLAALTAALFASGCSSSPSQNILGSFFPSWMLCLGLGVLVAIVCRQVMVLVGFNDAIALPILTYLAVALAVTFLIWLLFFGQ